MTAAYAKELVEDLREIAVSIVDTDTREGRVVLHAADELERLSKLVVIYRPEYE